MNKVVLIGRLARDPEVRYSQNDTSMAIARFSLAVDRRGRSNNSQDGQTADFISCVAFGRTAEFIEKYFTKGNRTLRRALPLLRWSTQTSKLRRSAQTSFSSFRLRSWMISATLR